MKNFRASEIYTSLTNINVLKSDLKDYTYELHIESVKRNRIQFVVSIPNSGRCIFISTSFYIAYFIFLFADRSLVIQNKIRIVHSTSYLASI